MGNKFNVEYALIRFPPFRKPSHVTCSQPVALCKFSRIVTSSIYADTALYQTQQNTAVYVIYHTNTCRFWSGRWWCCNVPKRAPARSVSEARGWPSATGWLQRMRYWASPETERDRNTVLSLSLSLTVTTEWRSRAFWNLKREEKPMDVIPSPTFFHKSKKK